MNYTNSVGTSSSVLDDGSTLPRIDVTLTITLDVLLDEFTTVTRDDAHVVVVDVKNTSTYTGTVCAVDTAPPSVPKLFDY